MYFLFISQNICCWYSKEPSDGSFELQKQMLKMRVKKIFTILCIFFFSFSYFEGAQWFSGRVLDSRLKGRWFEPHRRHCVVVLEQGTFILA